MPRILRGSDAGTVVDAANKHCISGQMMNLWRKRFGKLEAFDVRRRLKKGGKLDSGSA